MARPHKRWLIALTTLHAAGLCTAAGCTLSAEGNGQALRSADDPATDPASDAAVADGSNAMPPEVDVPSSGDAGAPPASDEPPPALRFDQLQLKGTYKSYHVAPGLRLDAATDFSHAPLVEQLERQQVRALQLDLRKNGRDLEVYNAPIVDTGTRCQKLTTCLSELKTWSASHPSHVPVVVWLEVLDTAIDDGAVDKLLRESFSSSQLFTPKQLQGPHASPRAALESAGWPTLSALRGKLMFVLSGSEALLAAQRGKAGSAMFTRATEAQYQEPWAVFTRIEDAADREAIEIAREHQLLTSAITCMAGESDELCTVRRDAALAHGIHLLLDTYPVPVETRSYWLDMSFDGEARCNPVSADPSCDASSLTTN